MSENRETVAMRAKNNLIETHRDLCDLLMAVCGGMCSKSQFLELCQKLGIRRYGKTKNGVKKRGRIATKSNLDDVREGLRQLARAELLSEDYIFENQKFLVAKSFLYKYYEVPPINLKKDVFFTKSLMISQYLLSRKAQNLNDMKRIIASTTLTHRKGRKPAIAKYVGVDQDTLDQLTKQNIFVVGGRGFEEYNTIVRKINEYARSLGQVTQLLNQGKIDEDRARELRGEAATKYKDVSGLAIGAIPDEFDKRSISLVVLDVYLDFDNKSITDLAAEIRDMICDGAVVKKSKRIKRVNPHLEVNVLTYSSELAGHKYIGKDLDNISVKCTVYKTNKRGSESDQIKSAAARDLIRSDRVYIPGRFEAAGMVLVDDMA